MKKRLLVTAVAALVLSAMIFAGCTRSLMWIENSGRDHIRATYKLFTGIKEKRIKACEGDTLTIDFDSEVGKGSLSLTIEDPDGECVLTMESGTQGSETIEIAQSGHYKLVIDGDETSGRFDISWSVE